MVMVMVGHRRVLSLLYIAKSFGLLVNLNKDVKMPVFEFLMLDVENLELVEIMDLAAATDY